MADIKYLDKTGLGTVKSILDGLFATKSHSHTKGEIGLGNVDNTADKDKNVKYAASAGYADDSNLLDGKDSTYFDTAPFSTIRDFTLGTLIKTDINYNVTSGDPFYVEIKGNTYVSPGSMHIQIQGYIYNDTIINYSVTSLGVVYPSEIIAKNIGGNLCFWFPRIAYWHGYYIKVTTGYNYSVNRVTDVLDSAEPSGTKRVVLTNTFYTNYSNSNLTISGGGASGGSSLSIKANSTTYSLTIPTSLPASDVYLWAKAANKPSYNASEVGALPFFKLASGNANDLSQGLTTVTATITNQEGSNHSAFLTITDIGTPFQLQIPDSSTNYIYKRYKSGSTWSSWSKLSAGYADTAGSAVDQTARDSAAAKWTWNADEIKAVKVNNAGQSSITHYTSIGASSDTHDSALKNYFNSNKSSIPRNSLLGLYSNSYGNGSYYMGYWLSGYDTNPYGGFYIAHYNTPYYVGIMNGSYSQQKILTSTNYTDYVAPKEHTHDYAPATHSHNYLPLSGGTLTGSVTFANGTWNIVGDDAAIGDYNAAGMLGLKSVNNNIPGIGFHNSSGTLLGSLKCDAGTLKWNDTAISLNGHGNHVPSIQAASNKVFLRNDNTWQTITPANIGAATSGHTHSLGNKSADDKSSTYPEGISIGGIYNNGYPFSYGSTITACGNGGYFQIAGQWNSDVTSLTDYDKPTEMYIRGRRDSYDVWTTWSRVLTDRNYTSCINTTNFPGINKTGTVTKVSTGTGLTGGDITGTGTISINSTYQTYISNGNTAHGWGNHANAGYVKSSGVTKVSTGTGLTGGDITGTGTVSINSTYQTYISNGNTAHGWGNHANAGYMKTSQYGFSPNTYTFNIAQNDKGWIYLGYIYGSNSGLKIECDYASHCGNDYGLFASHLILGVRPYSLEGFISKVKGSSGGLYITEEPAANGYNNYRVYIYLKAWYQGQVRISSLGSNEFVWAKTEEAPNSSHTVVLDTRELDGYYTCHKGTLTKASLDGHSHRITKLHRRDDVSDYNLQHHWTGSYWYLRGYLGDDYHAGVQVAYANSAGTAGSATSASSAATLSGGSIATWGTLTSGNGYTNVCTWDTGNTTGAFSLAGKGGQMSLQLDGYFYQNEGANRVTDVTETVTALGTNGNYLTWTKNGSTNNITVPYATLAGKLQASSNTITSTSNDTTAKWGALHNTIHFYATTGQLTDQPSQYGLVLNFNNSGSEVHQFWLTQASGDAYHRGGNSSGWSGTWRKFLDSSNYTTYTVKKDGTGASGTWGISITGNANYANSAGSAVDQTARDSAAAKLPLAGGTMTGNITFDVNRMIRWHSSDSYSISYPTGGNGAYLLVRAYEGATVSKRLTVYKSSSATDMPNTSYTIYTNGTIAAAEGFFDTSDERLKDFYNDIDINFDKLCSIPKKYFSWKADDKNEIQIGTSAQAVKEIYPELVSEDTNGTLSVSYNKLSIIALAAIDKLHDENQELKSKISTLEERLAKLEKLLEA